MRKTLVIVVLILMASTYAFAGNTINWKDAADYYGKYKTVEGTIVSGKCLPKVCFLNFAQDYRTTLTAVIFASDLSTFPPNPDQFYRNKEGPSNGDNKGI